jgi:hypothetical protein
VEAEEQDYRGTKNDNSAQFYNNNSELDETTSHKAELDVITSYTAHHGEIIIPNTALHGEIIIRPRSDNTSHQEEKDQHPGL